MDHCIEEVVVDKGGKVQRETPLDNGRAGMFLDNLQQPADGHL